MFQMHKFLKTKCCPELKGNYYNLYDADYEKWTKCFKKYAILLDKLLGVCKFTGYTAQFNIISIKHAHTELYIQ